MSLHSDVRKARMAKNKARAEKKTNPKRIKESDMETKRDTKKAMYWLTVGMAHQSVRTWHMEKDDFKAPKKSDYGSYEINYERLDFPFNSIVDAEKAIKLMDVMGWWTDRHGTSYDSKFFNTEIVHQIVLAPVSSKPTWMVKFDEPQVQYWGKGKNKEFRAKVVRTSPIIYKIQKANKEHADAEEKAAKEKSDEFKKYEGKTIALHVGANYTVYAVATATNYRGGKAHTLKGVASIVEHGHKGRLEDFEADPTAYHNQIDIRDFIKKDGKVNWKRFIDREHRFLELAEEAGYVNRDGKYNRDIYGPAFEWAKKLSADAQSFVDEDVLSGKVE